MHFAGVAFDLFGTLIDNFQVDEYQGVLDEMARALGAPRQEFSASWIDAFGERVLGRPPTLEDGIREICRRVGVEPEAAQVAAAARARLDYSARVLATRRHSVETLEELKRRGLPLALVSDCTWEIPALWTQTPYPPYFATTVFSCELGIKKPDRRMFQLACAGLGVEPAQCLYIGDGASAELSGAQAAGLTALQLRAPDETERHYGRNQAEPWRGPRIANIAQVLDYLD